MTLRRFFACAAIALLFAGCGGNAAGLVPQVRGFAERSHATAATLTLRIKIPIVKSVRSRYTSPATEGMSVSISGPTKVEAAFPLLKGSPGCTQTATARTCLIPVQLKTGSYTGTVNTYSKPPGLGGFPSTAKLLAVVSDEPFTVKAGNNILNFTSKGVVATIKLVAPRARAGTASSPALSVEAFDPDGYAIAGPYDSPITLSTSDTTGTVKIETSGADNPPAGKVTNSGDVARVVYTGLAIRPVTISASAAGAKTVDATFAPALSPIGPAALTGGVYVNFDITNPIADVVRASKPRAGSRILRPHNGPIAFTVSEPGWSTFHHTFTATPDGTCAGFVTVTPSSGTTFTATLKNSPPYIQKSCILTMTDGLGQSLKIPLGFATYAYQSSSPQSLPVPTGVTSLTITAWGAAGGPAGGSSGGSGGGVSATFSVTAKSVIELLIGGAGGPAVGGIGFGGAGGYNGGAYGGHVNHSSYTDVGGGGGGGATSVTVGGTLFLIAGGGGGGAYCSVYATGGNGGGTTGTNGGACSYDQAGNAGTQSAGGSGGSGGAGSGISGARNQGGTGGNGSERGAAGGGGGGGGGGYFGGGGGAGGNGLGGGTGGGGSGWTDPSLTNVRSASGVNANTYGGLVLVTW